MLEIFLTSLWKIALILGCITLIITFIALLYAIIIATIEVHQDRKILNEMQKDIDKIFEDKEAIDKKE